MWSVTWINETHTMQRMQFNEERMAREFCTSLNKKGFKASYFKD